MLSSWYDQSAASSMAWADVGSVSGLAGVVAVSVWVSCLLISSCWRLSIHGMPSASTSAATGSTRHVRSSPEGCSVRFCSAKGSVCNNSSASTPPSSRRLANASRAWAGVANSSNPVLGVYRTTGPWLSSSAKDRPLGHAGSVAKEPSVWVMRKVPASSAPRSVPSSTVSGYTPGRAPSAKAFSRAAKVGYCSAVSISCLLAGLKVPSLARAAATVASCCL